MHVSVTSANHIGFKVPRPAYELEGRMLVIPMGACQISRKHKVFELASSYVGAVVGAGFASGQEQVHFFFSMRLRSGQDAFSIGPGVFLSGALFMLFGAALGELVFRYQTSSSQEFLRGTVPWPLSILYDSLMTCFIFWSLSIMLAGSGALFHQSFGVPSRVGICIMAVFTILVTAAGVNGLLVVNSIMSPFMVLMPVWVAILSIWRNAQGLPMTTYATSLRNVFIEALTPSWPLSALLYVSYNILLVVGVFASIGRDISDNNAARQGGLLGGIAVTFFLIAVQAVLVVHGESVLGQQLPMLKAASFHGALVERGYSLALWFAMATTSVCSAFALSQRLSKHISASPLSAITAITVAASLPAQLGFTELVSTVYPIVGYMGLPVLASIILHFLKRPSELG